MSADVLDATWELDPRVAVRREPFGALAYHFETRQLTFLKTPELAAVLDGLDGATPARALLREAGVPEREWSAYARALSSLASAGMLRLPTEVSA